MRLARCERGHYYDKDKFSACPHCSGMQVAPGETVAYEDPNAPKEPEPPVQPTVPKVQVEDRIPFSANVAENPYSTEELARNTQAKLYTEEHNPMEADSDSPAQQENEPKLYTEEMDPLEEAQESQPLDEMKTLLLDEQEEPQAEATVESEAQAEEAETQAEETKPQTEEAEAAVESEAQAEETKPQTEEAEVAVESEAQTEETKPQAEEAEAVVESEAQAEGIETQAEEAEVTVESEAQAEGIETQVEESEPEKEEQPESVSLQHTVANAVSSRIPDEDALAERNSNPVVGWLIGIEGIHRGKSYDVKEGRNFIGRSTAMDICLAGNNRISRERHAIITYEPRSHAFFFQPDESRDLIYINDKLLLGPEVVNPEDVISMGEEQFVFLKLQSPKVDWIS